MSACLEMNASIKILELVVRPKGKMKLETTKGTIQEHNNGAIYNKLSGTFDKNENL